MTGTSEIPSADELVGALDALDVPFLMGGVQNETALALSPAALLQGLASAPEARMRSALIPLLLRHPELAKEAQVASTRLTGQPRDTLELFYTAALLLQRKYAARLARLFGAQAALPDLYSQALHIDLTDNVEASLARVGARHAELRGLNMNWVGGYEHAVRTWLALVELRAERRKQHVWQTT
ncbi:MAG: hypothetical protein HY741_13485 [Chloroflexi bacterium]|nr:hypothetical protein [Chloroflexota bacterium]